MEGIGCATVAENFDEGVAFDNRAAGDTPLFAGCGLVHRHTSSIRDTQPKRIQLYET